MFSCRIFAEMKHSLPDPIARRQHDKMLAVRRHCVFAAAEDLMRGEVFEQQHNVGFADLGRELRELVSGVRLVNFVTEQTKCRNRDSDTAAAGLPRSRSGHPRAGHRGQHLRAPGTSPDARLFQGTGHTGRPKRSRLSGHADRRRGCRSGREKSWLQERMPAARRVSVRRKSGVSWRRWVPANNHTLGGSVFVTRGTGITPGNKKSGRLMPLADARFRERKYSISEFRPNVKPLSNYSDSIFADIHISEHGKQGFFGIRREQYVLNCAEIFS